jgi:hypothetical protein
MEIWLVCQLEKVERVVRVWRVERVGKADPGCWILDAGKGESLDLAFQLLPVSSL